MRFSSARKEEINTEFAEASQRGPVAATKDLNTEVAEASQRAERRKLRMRRPALRLLRDLCEVSANSVLRSSFRAEENLILITRH